MLHDRLAVLIADGAVQQQLLEEECLKFEQKSAQTAKATEREKQVMSKPQQEVLKMTAKVKRRQRKDASVTKSARTFF